MKRETIFYDAYQYEREATKRSYQKGDCNKIFQKRNLDIDRTNKAELA